MDRLSSKVAPQRMLSHTYDAAENLQSIASSNDGGPLKCPKEPDIIRRSCAPFIALFAMSGRYRTNTGGNLGTLSGKPGDRREVPQSPSRMLNQVGQFLGESALLLPAPFAD